MYEMGFLNKVVVDSTYPHDPPSDIKKILSSNLEPVDRVTPVCVQHRTTDADST